MVTTKPEEESGEHISRTLSIKLSQSANQITLEPDGCFGALAKESTLRSDSTHGTTASVFAWQKNIGLRWSHPSHHSSVRAIALSSGGVHVASGDYNGNVVVGDAKTGQGTWNLTQNSPVSSLTLTHGGDALVSFARDGCIRYAFIEYYIYKQKLGKLIDS